MGVVKMRDVPTFERKRFLAYECLRHLTRNPRSRRCSLLTVTSRENLAVECPSQLAHRDEDLFCKEDGDNMNTTECIRLEAVSDIVQL